MRWFEDDNEPRSIRYHGLKMASGSRTKHRRMATDVSGLDACQKSLGEKEQCKP